MLTDQQVNEGLDELSDRAIYGLVSRQICEEDDTLLFLTDY